MIRHQNNSRVHLLAALAAIVLFTSGCSDRGGLDAKLQPDFAYELDTWMENSEVYEYTMKTSPNTACIVVILDALTNMGQDCFPKGRSGAEQKPGLQEPTAAYELDTWQENSEVYEFSPQSNLDWTCTMYILDNLNDMGLRCAPKEKVSPSNNS